MMSESDVKEYLNTHSYELNPYPTLIERVSIDLVKKTRHKVEVRISAPIAELSLGEYTLNIKAII